MTRIAQLSMYDFAEVRTATDALWQAMRDRLSRAGMPDLPERLTREFDHHEGWRRPQLLFGQSCGYPAMTEFRDRLRIIATPLYDAPGCTGSTHRSVIVVPARSEAESLAALRGGRFALNSWDSNSGMNLPRLAVAPLAEGGRFFGEIVETGSHVASLAAVAGGAADAAGIDCVTYALVRRHQPDLAAGVRILAETAASPALPFVTARGFGEDVVAALRRALADIMADPELAEIRAALLLTGVVETDASNYRVVLEFEQRARALGYPELS